MTLAFADQSTVAPNGAAAAEPIVETAPGEVTDFAESMLQRISVRSPYYALQDLAPDGDHSVTARVAVARPVAPESGLSSAAQVSRHLAILGSCAVAMQCENDNRMHYLATQAHFLRTASIDVEPVGESVESDDSVTLEAHATGTWIDRRNARALVRLLDPAGQTMHMLEVSYTVMAPRMFDRLHPPTEALMEQTNDSANGQSDDAIPFEVTYLEDGVEVDCGVIPESMCAGHFPGYPAAPVALVMGQLARAAGLALIENLGHGEIGYQVNEAKVVATKLGRAGQRLSLRVGHARPVGAGHLLICEAKADDASIGEMELTLLPTGVPEPRPFPIGAI